MVIRNENGSIYKLKGPNPLMKSQDQWEKFELHNLKFESETKKDDIPTTPIKTDFKIKSNVEEKIERIQEPIKSPTIPIIQSTKQEIEVLEEERNLDKIKIYCLPFTIKKNIDELYGEERLVTGYGKKFIFEAIIIENLDFKMLFWTNIEFIEPGSIIYPMNKDKRWWKIHQKEQKNNGWIYISIPSDIHPDFT